MKNEKSLKSVIMNDEWIRLELSNDTDKPNYKLFVKKDQITEIRLSNDPKQKSLVLGKNLVATNGERGVYVHESSKETLRQIIYAPNKGWFGKTVAVNDEWIRLETKTRETFFKKDQITEIKLSNDPKQKSSIVGNNLLSVNGGKRVLVHESSEETLRQMIYAPNNGWFRNKH